MTRDDIIRMAEAARCDILTGQRDSGEIDEYIEAWPEQLEKFAALVAAAEREECAQIVQSYMDKAYIGDDGWNVARDVLNDIRTRSEK